MFGKVKFILFLLFIIFIAESKKSKNRLRNRSCRNEGQKCGIFWQPCCKYELGRFFACSNGFIGKCERIA